MFIQVIQGPAADAGELREALDRWVRELAPGSTGWLGTTAGVTDDGTFVALARFESAEAARRNSDRPEQGQWWVETAKLFGGEVVFHDYADVEEFGGGGADDAGFVQIMQGRVRDGEAMRALMRDSGAEFEAFRPEVIGGVDCLDGDSGFTDAIYFTYEAAAREGERKEMPPEMASVMERMGALMEGDVTYMDLRSPWLYSPR
jgi:hypothetical protein